MTPSIRERLLQAEDSFLAASDESQMEIFQRTWNILAADILQATKTDQMSQDDLILADTVSSRITILCEAFEEFSNACDTISFSFERDLKRIFEERDRAHQSTHICSPSVSRQQHFTTAPYIPSAYAWLIDNLANPYPPKELRETIAKDTGSDLKHIESWFGDVRKRIGWSRIRKRHFSNKRHLAVQAAEAFFSNQPSSILPEEVRQDFASMLTAAKGLYAGKLMKRQLGLHTEENSDVSLQQCLLRSPRFRPLSAADCNQDNDAYRSTQHTCRKRSRSCSLARSHSPSRRKRFRSNSTQSVSLLPGSVTTTDAAHGSVSQQMPGLQDNLVSALTTSEKQHSLDFVSCLPNHSPRPQVVFDAMPDTTIHPKHVYSSTPPISFGSIRAPQACPDSSTKYGGTIGSTSSPSKTFTSPQLTHSPVLTSPYPKFVEITPIHKSSPPFPHFTSELPETVMCDQPATQMINLVLCEADFAQTCLSPSSVVSGLENAKSVDPTALSSDPILQSDVRPLVNFDFKTPDHDQIVDIMGAVSTNPALMHPDVLSAPRDIHLSNLMSLDTTSFYLPEPFLGNVPADHVGNYDNLFAFMESDQSKAAQLEQLKKHRNYIQEQINLLEIQIAGAFVA